MKKRFLCLILAIVMIVPFVLASCGESEDDKMKEIILGGDGAEIDRALTLSIWLPTDAITIKGQTADLSQMSQQNKLELQKSYPDVYDFLRRVDEVEDAINKVLISRNYYTNIDIVPVNNEFYEEALAERFAKMDEKSNPFDMNNKGDSNAYANEVVEEIVGNKKLYNLLYRPVDENQLDIFLIRDYGEYSGYEQYMSYIEKGYLLPLNKTTDANGTTDLFPKTNYITATGTYTSINKLIRTEIMSSMKVNDLIYALPNNHLYASQEYFAVNKDVFEKLSGEYSIKSLTDFDSIVAYMNSVSKLNDATVVPMLNNGSVPAFGLVDLDNLTYGDSALNDIFSNEEFVNFVRAYKQAEADGLIASELVNGQTAAVELFLGENVEEINAKAEDYYLIPVGEHKVDSSELYSSMFAISTFSLDYDRAMKILNLLVSDSQIVTMLQYGIENEDYSIKVDKVNGHDVETLNLNKDTSYQMNNMYTGSSYYTFPHNGATIDQWDDVKNANLNMVIGKYVNTQYYIDKATLTDEEAALLAKKSELAEIALAAFASIDEMSLESFNALIELIANEGDLTANAEYAEVAAFLGEASYDELIALYDKVMG